jgi:hypothetical protein
VTIFSEPSAGSLCCTKLNIAVYAELRQDPSPPSRAMMVGWGGVDGVSWPKVEGVVAFDAHLMTKIIGCWRWIHPTGRAI